MIYKHANFHTFSYIMMVDFERKFSSEFFELDGIKYKIHPPYKCYPDNFDFTPLPLAYINHKSDFVKLPNFSTIAIYPVLNKEEQCIQGYAMQNLQKFDLEMFSGMKFENIEFPEKLPPYFPVDTFRIDSDKESHQYSPKMLKNFIGHLRNLSGQWWIGKIHLSATGVNVFGSVNVNHTLGGFKYISAMYPRLKTTHIKPIDIEIWKAAISALENDEEVDLVQTLIMDAKYELSNNNLRVVVLNLANALDIAVNRFFLDYWIEEGFKEADFERSKFVKKFKGKRKTGEKDIRDTFIPLIISLFTEKLINRNYENEFNGHFLIIDDFWRNYRNPVAHGTLVEFSWEKAYELFSTVTHLVNWLDDLPV